MPTEGATRIIRAIGRWVVRRKGREWPAARLTISASELERAGIVGKFASVEVSPGSILITPVSLTAQNDNKCTVPQNLSGT
jgi:hypothetical protein